jgi:hypothetical protein
MTNEAIMMPAILRAISAHPKHLFKIERGGDKNGHIHDRKFKIMLKHETFQIYY